MPKSNTSSFLALFIGQGLNILVTFLFVPFLSRSLDVADFGTYGQVLMIVEFVRAIFTAGLGKVIYTFYGDQLFSNDDVYKNNTLAGFILGALASIILICSSSFIATIFKNEHLGSLINIFALSIPFSIVYQSINSTLIFYHKTALSAQISVISNLLRLVLMVIVFQMTASLAYLFVAMLVGFMLQYLLGIIAVKKLEISKGSYQPSLMKAQMIKGFSFGLISILGVAFLYSTGFIISYLEGAEQYAIYRNGAFEMPFVSSLYGSISMAILPDTVRLFNEQKYDEIVSLKRKAILHTALIIIPIVVFILFFHRPLIVLYLSEKYAASSIIFMIFSFILLIRVTSYEDIFVANGNSDFVMKVNIAALLLNILISCILVSQVSIVGAAIASVLSTYFIVFCLLKETAKILRCKISNLFDFHKIIKTLIFSLLSVGSCYAFYISFPSTSVIIFSFILLFIALFIFTTYVRLYDINILKGLHARGLIPSFLWTKVETLYLSR